MEVVATEIYKNAKELLYNTPTEGNKIEIENEEEVIEAIRGKICLLVSNAPKPCGNTFYLSLSQEERIVLFNWLKNSNKLDQLITYNLWCVGKNYIYL